jgi:hypothetical protein
MKASRLVTACLIVVSVHSVAISQCDCPFQFDPNQNAIPFEVGDAVVLAEIVFGTGIPETTGACPCADGDANCDGLVDVIDMVRMLRVICGDEALDRVCQPATDCSTQHCPGLPSNLAGGSVIIESKTVPANAQNAEIGIYLQNGADLGGLLLPLEIRSVTPGSFISGDIEFMKNGRMLQHWGAIGVWPLEYYYPTTTPSNTCSGPLSSTYDSNEVLQPPASFTSPAGFLWGTLACGANCLPPGDDGPPGTGNPSLIVSFGVTGVPGSFEIDTCCIAPGNHLSMIDCDGDSVFSPTFTKGVVTIAPCDCPALNDANHNGIPFEIGDWVRMTYLAFGGEPSTITPTCRCSDGDVDCNGLIDVVDLVRMVHVISGQDDGSGMCAPTADCSIEGCPPLAVEASGGNIVIESKVVLAGAQDVEIGIYLDNNRALSALTLPLELRTIDGGFVHDCEMLIPALSRIPSSGSNSAIPLMLFHSQTALVNSCSGPVSSTFNQWDTIPPGQFPSPFGMLWACLAPDTTGCIPAGSDGSPGSGNPSIKLSADIASFSGSFEIDTCCIAPGTHLAMVECGGDTIFAPTFTKGVITVLTSACDCPCAADPQCDGVHDIVDVTSIINAAFRAGATISDNGCGFFRQDVNCSGAVDILDVVTSVGVAFRGGSADLEFCDGCP